MVSKAIIEEVTHYGAKVRIPTIHKSSFATGADSIYHLDEALICSLPGVKPNFQVGDVVYVAFEEDNTSTPVILGMLNSSKSDSYCDMKASSLEVVVNASLPHDTAIGEVKSKNIDKLLNIEVNIARELVRIKKELSKKDYIIESLQKDIKRLEQQILKNNSYVKEDE